MYIGALRTMSKILSKSEGNHQNLQDYYQIKVINPNDILSIISSTNVLNLIYQKVKPKIEGHNIKFYIVPQPPSELDIWWTDYAEDYLQEFYGKEFKNNSYLAMIIKLNENMTIYTEESIIIDHSLNLEERQLVFDIFYQELPYYYLWNGKISNPMEITYHRNFKPIDHIEIKESDIYPSLEIFIEAELDRKLNNEYNISSFNDNPYENSDNFSILWQIIQEKSDVNDFGYSLKKLEKETFMIDFLLYSIEDMDIIKKILEVNEIKFSNFILKVVDISGVLFMNKNKEIEISKYD